MLSCYSGRFNVFRNCTRKIYMYKYKGIYTHMTYYIYIHITYICIIIYTILFCHSSLLARQFTSTSTPMESVKHHQFIMEWIALVSSLLQSDMMHFIIGCIHLYKITSVSYLEKCSPNWWYLFKSDLLIRISHTDSIYYKDTLPILTIFFPNPLFFS